MYLMLNLPFSSLLFRSALAARDRLAAAFLRYHIANCYTHPGASAYIRAWTEHSASRGIPPADIARFHVGNLFALVANTVPAAFWTVYHIFSAEPEVLAACRAEVERAVTVGPQDGNEQREGQDVVCTLRAREVVSKERCPTLLAFFQEVLRAHGMMTSVRVAGEDCWLDDGKYLIKKGGMVMMPARVQHRLREVWGEDAEAFDHARWLPAAAKGRDGGPRSNPVAFRGFGGGTTLCPGRHFATNEILLFVAMLLLRFDVVPTGDGGWVMPTTSNSSQAEAVEQPDHDIQIELRPRPGADRTWRVSFEGAGETALVVEDMEDVRHSTRS
jgi:cytochrome P450